MSKSVITITHSENYQQVQEALQSDDKSVCLHKTASYISAASAGLRPCTAISVVTDNNDAVAASEYFTFDAVVADNVITIAGITLTAKASPSGEAQFGLDAVSQSSASKAAAKVNAHSKLPSLVSAAATGLAKATGTFAFSSVVAGNTLSINGVTFTAATTPATEVEFEVGVDDTATAHNAAVVISAHSTVGLLVVATHTTSTVNLEAKAAGGHANAIALVGSTNITRSGALMTGGTDKLTITAATAGTAGNSIALDGTALRCAPHAAYLASGTAATQSVTKSFTM